MTSPYEFSAECDTHMGDWMYAQRACDASVKLATVSAEGEEINVYLSDADAQDLADYLLAVIADRNEEDEPAEPRETKFRANCDTDEDDKLIVEECQDENLDNGFGFFHTTSMEHTGVYLDHYDSCRLRDFLARSLAERETLEHKSNHACSNETLKTGSSATPTLSDIFVLNSVLTALTAFQTELSSLLEVCSSSNLKDREAFCDRSNANGKRS